MKKQSTRLNPHRPCRGSSTPVQSARLRGLRWATLHEPGGRQPGLPSRVKACHADLNFVEIRSLETNLRLWLSAYSSTPAGAALPSRNRTEGGGALLWLLWWASRGISQDMDPIIDIIYLIRHKRIQVLTFRSPYSSSLYSTNSLRDELSAVSTNFR